MSFKVISLQIVGLALLVVSFQNCGSEVAFDTTAGVLVAKTDNTVSAEDIGEEEDVPMDEEMSGDDGSNQDMGQVGSQPGSQPPGMPPVAGEQSGNQGQGNANRPPEMPESDKKQCRDTDPYFICILEGPGESVNLGYVDELQANGSAPDSVCMSKNACLNIVSKKFVVKKASYRGFCKNADKNGWQVFTDLQISEMLNQK